jgi:hypothetical protein
MRERRIGETNESFVMGYVSPAVETVEIQCEGAVLAASNGMDADIGGWESGNEDLGGEAT